MLESLVVVEGKKIPLKKGPTPPSLYISTQLLPNEVPPPLFQE
jgi:hypothetical protein